MTHSHLPGWFQDISLKNVCLYFQQTSKSLRLFLLYFGISEHRFSVRLLFCANDLQMSGSWAQSCLQEQPERLHMRVETKRFGSTPWRTSVHQQSWTPTRQNDRKHKLFRGEAEKNLNVEFPVEFPVKIDVSTQYVSKWNNHCKRDWSTDHSCSKWQFKMPETPPLIYFSKVPAENQNICWYIEPNVRGN